ncbi:MAG TPA: gluconate 2-dehydrogenase subunit 3 family protein [Acidobacteriota bacterium]|nr:gluconate 2-dehydrogenase subunit 3 family protein [Acidobacteriota bacterium]
MKRRDLLKQMGAALGVPALAGLSSSELLALGHALHRPASSAPAAAPQALHVFRTLDAHQDRTVSKIADMIIPPTDTAGALDVGANEFMDRLLSEWYPQNQKDFFLRGLASLDAKCQQRFSADFIDCQEDAQIEILQEEEAEAIRLSKEAGSGSISWGVFSPPIRHYFHMLKWMTLFAYYTSQEGMVEELGWKVIPGQYIGCRQNG